MTEAGVKVITLSEVGRSLEDVYLQVVADGENGLGSRGEKEH